MADEDGIDWGLIDIRLAVADGAEGCKRRNKLFTQLDPNGNRSLSLIEVTAGMAGLLAGDSNRKKDEKAVGLIPGITDFRPAIKAAFKNARHLGNSAGAPGNDTVDRSEFHALLVFFRNYVELLALFKKLDDSGDMILSEEEIKPALSRLEKWDITGTQVKQKLAAEPGHKIAFDHFAEWCLRSKLASFVFDTNEGADQMSPPSSPSGPSQAGKGKVNWAAVDERIPTGPGDELSEERDELFKKMDITNQKSLTLTSVQASMCFLLEGDHAQRKKGSAAEQLIPKEIDTRPAVKSAFLAARDLAPPPTVNGKKKKKKKDSYSRDDDTVDRREFHALLVYLRFYLELQVLFQELDTSEDNRVSKEEATSTVALTLLSGWGIDKAAVNKKFAETKTGELKFASFADWCLRIKLDGHVFDVIHLEGDQLEEEQAEEASLEVVDSSNKDEIVEEKAVPKEVEGNEAPAQPSDEPEEEKDIDNTAESSKKSLEAEAFQETLDFREGDFREVPAERTLRNTEGMRMRPMAKSCSSLPMVSTGVLKRSPHLKTLSHVRSLPKWKFGEKRPSSFFITNENPAPGSYGFNQEKTGKFREHGASSFGGGASRFDLRSEKPAPAPGEYGIPRNPTAEMSQKVAFSMAQRRHVTLVRTQDPGPGAYEAKSTLGTKSCTAKGKLPVFYKPVAALPGPGAYNPRQECMTHERTAPKVGFGTSTRDGVGDRDSRRAPGPGAYDSDTFQKFGRMCKKVSFSSRMRSSVNFNSYVTPGPGSYDGDGTCFGY